MPAIFRDENKKSTSVRRNVLSPVSLLYKEWGDDRRFPFFSCGPFTGVTQMYLNGWSVTVWLIPMTISLSKPSFFFFREVSQPPPRYLLANFSYLMVTFISSKYNCQPDTAHSIFAFYDLLNVGYLRQTKEEVKPEREEITRTKFSLCV